MAPFFWYDDIERFSLGAETVKTPSLDNDEAIFSILTPEGRENLCSNCLDTKDCPPSALVWCFARTMRTSPSVLILSSYIRVEMHLLCLFIFYTYLWGVVLDIELHLELILIIAHFSLGRHVVRLGNSSFGNWGRCVGGTLGYCLLGLGL